jgi:hypothetical protein
MPPTVQRFSEYVWLKVEDEDDVVSMKAWLCGLCGALVGNTDTHLDFHRRIKEKIW